MWLFDGLDELYTGDKDFFDHILDFLTRPNTKAQILICARNSLLTTNDAFSRMLEEFPPESNPIEIYELSDWEAQSKRLFAWRRLEGRNPRRENDTKEVADFLSILRQSPAFQAISKLPYYCSLLMDEFRENGSVELFSSEFHLLDHVIHKMIGREMDKGLISGNYFETNGLEEWLQANGLKCYQDNYKGFLSEDVKEYAELVLRSDLTDEDLENAVTSLVQFPLFTTGMVPGTTNFKHELIAEYLAAKCLLNMLDADPFKAARMIGDRLDFAESLACRFIAGKISTNQEMKIKLVDCIKSRSSSDRSFAHLLQILVLIDKENNMYRDFHFDTCDLRGINFEGIDFRGASFCYADLNGAKFVSCNLQNTKFENAAISGTHFDAIDEDALHGADFGHLEHFESVSLDGKRIDDRDSMRSWIRRNTGSTVSMKEPCPTARQLLVLFRKYVHADGSGRRNELKHDALQRGRHYSGAPRPEECVSHCMSYGYLQRPNHRQRVERASGGRYDEMVEYVKDWKMSENVRVMLDSLCAVENCPHVPF